MAEIKRMDGTTITPTAARCNEKVAAMLESIKKRNDAGQITALYACIVYTDSKIETRVTQGPSDVSAIHIVGTLEVWKQDLVLGMLDNSEPVPEDDEKDPA